MSSSFRDDPVTALLRRSPTVFVDGGLATELEVRGHQLRDELWSARLLADDPAALRAVHGDYVAAGADVLVSASYQATFDGFERVRGCGREDAARLLRRSVDVAREAAGDDGPLVAASVGPYGAALADGSEYTGDYDLDTEGLHRWHRDRFRVLAESGADLLAMETVPSLSEARALLRLLDETPGPPGWISFSCRDDERIADGTPLADCVAAVADHPGLVAVGVNCTPPRFVESLVSIAASRTSLPIIAYPNSGERWDAASRCWHGDPEPDRFVDEAVRWRAAGARLIGGCCRTGPEHVRRLRARLLS